MKKWVCQFKEKPLIIFVASKKSSFQEKLGFWKFVSTFMSMSISQYLKIFLTSLVVIYNFKTIYNEIGRLPIFFKQPMFDVTDQAWIKDIFKV